MSNRNERGKPAFLAQEEALGGAHMILGDYVSLHRRAAGAVPTREILLTKKQPYYSNAQRLSFNRAVRRAVVDTTSVSHVHNVYHLNRRIEGMYSATERKKNLNDPTMYPVFQRRSGTHGQSTNIHQQLLEPWQEGHGYNTLPESARPGSASAGRSRAKWCGDSYQGWSATNSLRHNFWGDDFPLYQGRGKGQEATDYGLYRQAIMAEIVAERLYRESDLRRLFKAYLTLSPLHDKQVVERVISELRGELHVS